MTTLLTLTFLADWIYYCLFIFVLVICLYTQNLLVMSFFLAFYLRLLGEEDEPERPDESLESEDFVKLYQIYSINYMNVVFDESGADVYDDFLNWENFIEPRSSLNEYSNCRLCDEWEMTDIIEEHDTEDVPVVIYSELKNLYQLFSGFTTTANNFHFGPDNNLLLMNSSFTSWKQQLNNKSDFFDDYVNCDDVENKGNLYLLSKEKKIFMSEKKPKINLLLNNVYVMKRKFTKTFTSETLPHFIMLQRYDFFDAVMAERWFHRVEGFIELQDSKNLSYGITKSNQQTNESANELLLLLNEVIYTNKYFQSYNTFEYELLEEAYDVKECNNNSYYFFHLLKRKFVYKNKTRIFSINSQASYMNLSYMKLPWQSKKLKKPKS